jgi:predicted  nucleic acid-binding Zn-ribbon protein
VNTVADAIRQIRDAAQECETVIKRLAKNLDKMNKEFQDTKKKAGAQAKEVGKTIADTILNYPLFPTVKTCGDDCTLADNKSAGLNVKHVKLGGDVSKALKKLDDLDKFLAKAKTNKEIAKIQKDVIKIRKTLDEALKKTSAIGERVTFCEDLVEQCQELLVEVEAGAGKWLTVFEKVFPIVYNLAMAGANAGVGFVDAKNALETANTALGLTNDVLTEVKNNIPD